VLWFSGNSSRTKWLAPRKVKELKAYLDRHEELKSTSVSMSFGKEKHCQVLLIFIPFGSKMPELKLAPSFLNNEWP